MSEILFQYQRISPTTWVYVSSLMTIGLFFKFSRLWSVRNLDVLLLVALAPGLLMVVQGQKIRRTPVAETAPRDEAPPEESPDGVTSDGAASDGGGASPFLSVGETVVSAADENGVSSTGDTGTSNAGSGDTGSSDTGSSDRGSVETGSDAGGTGQGAGGTVEPLDSDTFDDDPAEAIGSGPSEDALAVAQEQLPPNVAAGRSIETKGYYWLFAVGLLLLARLLIDPTMVRRPLLEPNLTTGGLVFLACALLAFLMANVITGTPTDDDLYGPAAAEDFMARRDASGDENALAKHGPGLRVLSWLPTISTSALVEPPHNASLGQQERFAQVVTAKTMAILSHLAIVIGIIAIGYWHFGNIKMGLGAATLYLLLPYTAEMTGRVNHALPGALLIWALATYRRPLVSGMFLGLAAGVVYYPLYLLPLWCSFYWRRGLARFLGGVLAMLALFSLSIVFTAKDFNSFWLQFNAQFGLHWPAMEELEGIWSYAWDSAYRIPILAAFVALSGTLALWPPRKNFGTLLSCSGAIMLAVQFWTGYFGGGGTIMAWYLPLLLLTIFRPNLEDRVAVAVLDKGRWPRLANVSKAA